MAILERICCLQTCSVASLQHQIELVLLNCQEAQNRDMQEKPAVRLRSMMSHFSPSSYALQSQICCSVHTWAYAPLALCTCLFNMQDRLSRLLCCGVISLLLLQHRYVQLWPLSSATWDDIRGWRHRQLGCLCRRVRSRVMGGWGPRHTHAGMFVGGWQLPSLSMQSMGWPQCSIVC